MNKENICIGENTLHAITTGNNSTRIGVEPWKCSECNKEFYMKDLGYNTTIIKCPNCKKASYNKLGEAT